MMWLETKNTPGHVGWRAWFDISLHPIWSLKIQPKLLSIACTIWLLQNPVNLSKHITCLQNLQVILSSVSLTVICLAEIIGCCRPAAKTWVYSSRRKSSEHDTELEIAECYSKLAGRGADVWQWFHSFLGIKTQPLKFPSVYLETCKVC